MTKAAGPLAGAIPPDAEVSPELVQALTSAQLNPEDIEIVTDSTGKTVIRLKTEVSILNCLQVTERWSNCSRDGS